MSHTHSESISRVDGLIPSIFKYIMTFIDRVGFPIFAFLVMTYMCFRTLDKLTTAIDRLTIAVESLRK